MDQRQRAAERKAIRRERADRTPAPVKPSRGRVHDAAHLAFIRRLPCIPGMVRGGCQGAVQACHVRYADAAAGWDAPGLQRKPDDARTLPACAGHHVEQHNGSERLWWSAMFIDPPQLCAALYAVSGDIEAGTRIIREAVER